MKELNDIDFDKAFKTRITEELPEFEEESWLKMEKKLRKRDRLIFLRYASILLVLLSFGISFYLLNKKSENKNDTVVVSKNIENIENKKVEDKNRFILIEPKETQIAQKQQQSESNFNQNINDADQIFKPSLTTKPLVKDEKLHDQENIVAQKQSINYNPSKIDDVITASQRQVVLENKEDAPTTANPIANNINADKEKSSSEIKAKVKRKIPISVAVTAGPDFSSTSSLIGGKTGLTFGVGLGIGLTKKLSIQTGMAFGSKNYYTSAYDYTFNNPNANKTIFSEIEAVCKVIEIPLKASYNISENNKRSIELNAGLSSYLMVREKYVFKYTAATNRPDRVTDISNENQHILSVIDVSATYNIKLKNKNFAFGIEPYIKIPLTGIGEGSVPLKSSGVSLKLRYDFNKN